MTRTRLIAALAVALAAAGCGYRVIGDRDLPRATAASEPRYSLLLADLRVAVLPNGLPDIDCQTRGGELFLRARVENVGDRGAPTFATLVTVNRKQVSTRTPSPLDPGRNVRLGFFFTGGDSIAAAPGDVFTVTAMADDALAHPPTGEVFEHIETNNSATKTCTVM